MKNNQKGFVSMILVGVIIVLVAIGGYFVLKAKQQPVVQQVPVTSADETANWKTYTNTEYGLELQYPPTWKIQEKVTGFGFWINPPDFKMPSSGTVNPYFSFDVTAHMFLGDEKPVTKDFGNRTGYVYDQDQSVYFPSSAGAGGYFIKLYTPDGIDEPNQILSTFKFVESKAILPVKSNDPSADEYSDLSTRFNLKYKTFEEAVSALKKITGTSKLSLDRIDTVFYVPGKIPREDGNPYFTFIITVDKSKNDCLVGYMNLVSGEVESRHDVCIIYN